LFAIIIASQIISPRKLKNGFMQVLGNVTNSTQHYAALLSFGYSQMIPHHIWWSIEKLNKI